jgi:hypothetical protein
MFTTRTISDSKPPTNKFGSSMTQKFGKGSLPRKSMQQRMFVENSLLKEARKFS